MSGVIFPDELSRQICEEIAYNKGRISLTYLWEFVSSLIPIDSDDVKKFIFNVLMSNEHIVLFSHGGEIPKEMNTIPEGEENLEIGITESKLWLVLTGYNKKECNIGNSAFELLLEIAKAKYAGINTKDVARETGQDPRSITGRIKKLDNLITSEQMIYKGHIVKLLKLKKFSRPNDDNITNNNKPYVSTRAALPKIVEVVKNSKNGIRQILDLKRELKFDQDTRTSKSFLSTLAWLDEKGFLKKVFVVSPNNPAVKIRCVKYIRDYISDEKVVENAQFDSDTTSEDDSDTNENTGMEEDDAFEELDTSNATSLLQQQGLVMEENINLSKERILLNRFFPIQNQTYDLALQAGISGVSTMEAVNKITGKDFKRGFSKASEYYISNIGKTKQKTKSISKIVRVYDFEGKKKFYRIFTKDLFNQLTGNAAEEKDDFPPMKHQLKTLSALNKAGFSPLSNTIRFTNINNEDVFFWHGELNIKPEAHVQTRGRKRKQPIQNTAKSPVKKPTKIIIEEPIVHKIEEHDASSVLLNKSPNDENISETLDPAITEALNKAMFESPDDSSKFLNVNGFRGGSLRSLWRQRAIVAVIKKTNGVTYLREQFYEDVSKELRSNTTIDKRTVRGDVDLMVNSGKLILKIEPVSGRRIIYLPEIGNEVISDYVLKEKDNKKVYSNDILHNTDIFFFDQTEKNRFHRGVKSVERIRKFQSRARPRTNKSSATKNKKSTQDQNQNTFDDLDISGVSKTSRKIIKTAVEKATSSKRKAKKEKKQEDKLAFHLGNKRGMRALIMAVVITKSIKNEIVWDKITRLFPSNSLENLKKQWTIRRVRMGHTGWKAYVDKWRKILVLAVKKGKASLEDAESLDLSKLINLWINYNTSEQKKSIILYDDYNENKKMYTLVKSSKNHDIKQGLAMSSMIQRETSSLKKAYMYDLEDEDISSIQQEEYAKSVVRSVIFEEPITPRENIEALNEFNKELLDKVILDMAKEKQLYIRGSKLECTPTVATILETKGDLETFERAEQFRGKVNEMINANTGILIANEFTDEIAWILIDLTARQKIFLDDIPVPRKNSLFNYTTRRFDVAALTPPLVVSAKNTTKIWDTKSIFIPSGNPFSRLWIDSEGGIRKQVWNHACSMVLKIVLFSPGVNPSAIHLRSDGIFSLQEVDDITRWLVQKDLLKSTPFDGFMVSPQWYTLLA